MSVSENATEAVDQTVEATEHYGKWLPLVTLALATLAVASELTFASFALPLIAGDFGVDSSTTAWVLLAYAIPMAALSISVGRWVDKCDLRAVFFLAVSSVALCNLLAAVAPTFSTLLVVRALQGFGSAMYMAAYLPLIMLMIAPHRRGRAMSYIVGIILFGNIGVAPLGGFIATHFGWREVFLIKLPLFAAILWMGYRIIPRSANWVAEMPKLAMPNTPMLVETLIMGGAVTCLLLGLEIVRQHIFIAALLSGLSLVLLVYWSRLPDSRPLIDLLHSRNFGLSVVALLLISSTMGIVIFVLPFYISDVIHRSPNVLGVAMLFFIGVASVVSPVAGNLVDKYGAAWVARIGSFVIAISTLTIATMGSDTGVVGLAWRMMFFGVGLAMFNSPNMTAILECTPPGKVGMSGGVINLFRTLGSSLGPAVAALAWALGGGALAGFRAGVLALSFCGFVGCVLLVMARGKGGTPSN